MIAEVYRNRKGWFSIVVRWPGSTHDSFIYNSSSAKQTLESGALEGILLADSGYAVSNVLLTPFLSPHDPTNKSKLTFGNVKFNLSLDS